MATFEELGTGLTIMILVINLFLAGFGGVILPNSFQTYLSFDQNITALTTVNSQYAISTNPYSTPTATNGSTSQNDPFGASVSVIARDAFGFFKTLLFGITEFAIKVGAPQGFLLGIIIPLNMIMIFYVVSYIASTTSGFLKGVLGV